MSGSRWLTAALSALLAMAVAMTMGFAGPAAAQANPKNIAPGFPGLSKTDRVLVMPPDVELFSLGAGGVTEPKADWTASAREHIKTALAKRKQALGITSSDAPDAVADEFAEQVALHAAVAGSIALHHSVGGIWSLPTKAEALNWTFGDAMVPLATQSGARYGLFVWVRDSYATAERKAAMVFLAMAGIGITAGIQVGYASLVDLQTGQVIWFNQMVRGTGDLREAEPARESIDALLAGFPTVR